MYGDFKYLLGSLIPSKISRIELGVSFFSSLSSSLFSIGFLIGGIGDKPFSSSGFFSSSFASLDSSSNSLAQRRRIISISSAN